MCLLKMSPVDDDDIVFANRRAPRRVTQTRTAQVVVKEPPAAQYIQAPIPPRPAAASVAPIVRNASPPSAQKLQPQPQRLEVIAVQQEGSPRTSRTSVSGVARQRSRHGSRAGSEREVFIERVSGRKLAPNSPDWLADGRSKELRNSEEGPGVQVVRSRSITYETNPRYSGRLVERHRVVVEDGGRRREYYRNR